MLIQQLHFERLRIRSLDFEKMHHPYQCLHICRRVVNEESSSNYFLLAASGSKLYSVHLSTGAIVSSWPPEDEVSALVRLAFVKLSF